MLAAVVQPFSLVDVNANSASFNQPVSPAQFSGEVSAWYFSRSSCGYCGKQFGHLNSMQAELATAHPQLKINQIGINQAGYESTNAQITTGRMLPWLQDVDADQDGLSDVWAEQWQVTYRDVVILNGEGEKVDLYNLTTYDLSKPENYSTLKQKLIDAALLSQLPWHNDANPVDVNGDTAVTPLDALLIINEMNATGARKLEAPVGSEAPENLYDTDGDGSIAPLDALLVINELNSLYAPSGEPLSPGESDGQGAWPHPFASTIDILALDAILGDTDEQR
jgi:hypothetical protein